MCLLICASVICGSTGDHRSGFDKRRARPNPHQNFVRFKLKARSEPPSHLPPGHVQEQGLVLDLHDPTRIFMATRYAFVTLITSDSYLPGALTLAAALRDIHPTPAAEPEVDFQTLCLVTPETVDVSSIKLLRGAFDTVTGVEIIEDEDRKGLELLGECSRCSCSYLRRTSGWGGGGQVVWWTTEWIWMVPSGRYPRLTLHPHARCDNHQKVREREGQWDCALPTQPD